MNKKEEACCVTSCDNVIDKAFWEERWQKHETGWDLSEASPTLVHYIDQISDRSAKILIPGCGNAYEASYLLDKGFTDITLIDISQTACDILSNKFKDTKGLRILCEDFFMHEGSYDIILEQTFFCALDPSMRVYYVYKMHQLLSEKGKLEGLLFNRQFEISPPFGGSEEEYRLLFNSSFDILEMKNSPYSVAARKDTELMFSFQKKNDVILQFYQFEGMTCESCRKKVSELFIDIEGSLDVIFNDNYSQVLIISKQPIDIEILRESIAYDPDYKIQSI